MSLLEITYQWNLWRLLCGLFHHWKELGAMSWKEKVLITGNCHQDIDKQWETNSEITVLYIIDRKDRKRKKRKEESTGDCLMNEDQHFTAYFHLCKGNCCSFRRYWLHYWAHAYHTKRCVSWSATYTSFCCLVIKSCPTLHDPMDQSTPGYTS